MAQAVPVPPQDFLDFTRRSGDRIHFCINAASALAEFDRAVAQWLADSLLVPAEFHDIVDADQPAPYDYIFTLEDVDLYVEVSNHCDAVMGFQLPQVGTVPEWLTVTAAYYSPHVVLAVTDPGFRTLADLPRGSTIGSQIATPADTRLRAFLAVQGAAAPWRRQLAGDNGALLDGLRAGTFAGIVIWEPALFLATGGDPKAAGLGEAALPFEIPDLQFGVALPSNQRALRTLLDQAIQAFAAEGGLSELLARFNLPDD